MRCLRQAIPSFDLFNLCVWVKNNGGMGSLYRSRHELVFVFRNGKQQHRNNVQLGRLGRNRTNVWNYTGANGLPGKGHKRSLELHPTVKPISLVADALLDATKQGDIVACAGHRRDGFVRRPDDRLRVALRLRHRPAGS